MKMLRSAALSVLAALSFVLALAVTAAPRRLRRLAPGSRASVTTPIPCSRTAPCKTFAGAISKTAAGGEINCLDPGGYGTVTITKSITIDCEDTQGSIPRFRNQRREHQRQRQRLAEHDQGDPSRAVDQRRRHHAGSRGRQLQLGRLV
jgi:hypothetical protein